MTRARICLIGSAALLVLYPIAWWAPILQAGVLPLFSLSEISVLSGIASLWQTDVMLAVTVAVFAVAAPLIKTLWMMGLASGWVRPGGGWLLRTLGRLAMAEVFLLALYITVVKGVGVGRIEVAWGLYLFTACVVAGLVIEQLLPGSVEDD